MIEVRVEPELLVKADEFSKFRENCKNYLTRVGMNYDKFTMVKHGCKYRAELHTL